MKKRRIRPATARATCFWVSAGNSDQRRGGLLANRRGWHAWRGNGGDATRSGWACGAIANHLLSEESQTRVQMLRQWDKGTQTDPGNRRPLRVRCDGGLAKISRRHPDRASPRVGKLDNDVRETSTRAFWQHRKLAAKQGMSRIRSVAESLHLSEATAFFKAARLVPDVAVETAPANVSSWFTAVQKSAGLFVLLFTILS